MRGRSTTIAAALGIVVLAGAGGLVIDDAARAYRAGHAVRYAPAPATPRPEGVETTLPDVMAIRDFDGLGGRYYLLDPLLPAVHEVQVERDELRYVGAFGRRGGGPGEFSTPTGIAVLRHPPRIGVIEPGRIHYFDLGGRYLESTAPGLPCAMPRPRIAAAARGLFVHGDCVRRSAGGDTLQAALFWSADGTAFEEVATDPRFALDGSFGSAFAADLPLGEGEDGRHVFGAGTTACAYLIEERTGAPGARRICDDSLRRYRLDLSARTRQEIERAARRTPVLAGALRVPEDHSPYAGLLMLGSRTAMLRGYSEDSVVLRLFGVSRDAAVLGRDGLVGCRRAGCMYANASAGGTTIRLIPSAELQRLVDSAARDR